LAERGLLEKLELVSAAPGDSFDFGRYRIVEEPIAHILEEDPVIGMTLGSQLFKLRTDATGLWSDTDLAAALS
jgi:carbamoylphosphate synthase small subunit